MTLKISYFPKWFYNLSGRVGGLVAEAMCWVGCGGYVLVKSEYIATLRPNPQVFPTGPSVAILLINIG